MEERRPNKKRLALSDAVIQRLYVEEGRTLQDVAYQLGCSADTIARRLEAMGIPRRRGKLANVMPVLQALQERGVSQRDMARYAHCSRTAIAYHLGASLSKDDKMGHLTDGVIKNMQKAYQQGQSPTRIGNEVGLTRSQVERVLRQAGVTLRRRTRRTQIDPQELRRLYVELNWTTESIAKVYHVKTATVSRLLREAGIAVRGHRLGLCPERVLTAYAEQGSYRAAAEVLGCAEATVARYVRQAQKEQETEALRTVAPAVEA